MSGSVHSRRAATALARLSETDPALGALALWCRHRDGEGPTRTEGGTIRYGADFAALPEHEQAGLAAHHVLHVALRHGPRAAALRERLGPAFGLDLYALAADAIVNEALILAGQTLPRPCLRLTELLSAIGERGDAPRTALGRWDADRLAMRLHADAATGRAARDHGAGRGFVPDLSAEGDASDGGGPGDGTEQRAADWRGHVLRALSAGRQAGEGIGTLGTVLADLAAPAIPWERRLRGLLAKAFTARPQRTHRRPANRWLAAEAEARASGRPEPIFEPGLRRRAVRPRLVVGLDTSSSIDDLTLSLFLAEARGIAARGGAEAHLLSFDETVHDVRPLAAGLPTRGNLRIRRGGGTSFVDLMAEAGARDPSAIVVLTDLGGAFGPAPRCPVVWAVPGDPPAPPYGRVVQIDSV